MSGFGDYLRRIGLDKLAEVADRNAPASAAFFSQQDSGFRDATEQLAEVTRRSDVTVPAVGTPYERNRVQEALAKSDEYIRNTFDKPSIHVGGNGQIDTDGAAFATVGLIHPWQPRIVHEISPTNPIWKILRDRVPLRQGECDERSTPCDMPGSVSIVGGGSIECTNIATSYVIAPALERRLIFVFRACEKCRDTIRMFNRSRMLSEGGQWVSEAHAQHIEERQKRRWQGNGGPT